MPKKVITGKIASKMVSKNEKKSFTEMFMSSLTEAISVIGITLAVVSFFYLRSSQNDIQKLDTLFTKQEKLQQQLASNKSLIDIIVKEHNDLNHRNIEYYNALSKKIDTSKQELANELVKDELFKGKLIQEVSKAPLDGVVSVLEFKKENIALKDKLDNNTKKINELVPIYDAIDFKDKENVLAIPMIRSDIIKLSESVDELKMNVDKEISKIHSSLISETSRIYDFGKWFMGLLIVSLVVPLLKDISKKTEVEKPENDKDGGADPAA